MEIKIESTNTISHVYFVTAAVRKSIIAKDVKTWSLFEKYNVTNVA